MTKNQYKVELTYKKVETYNAENVELAKNQAKTATLGDLKPCHVKVIEEIESVAQNAISASLTDLSRLNLLEDKEIECARCGKIIHMPQALVAKLDENSDQYSLVCKDCALKLAKRN